MEITLMGQRKRLIEAFPDVYGDFRQLLFLRKDKHQDPVAAANTVSRIYQMEERQRH